MASDSADRPSRDPAPKGKSRKTDPNAPIRKRRKRTVVSGAPDDCFACAKRGARCDRRRPYCSQCLDMGRECSGYKTTLTWGVGVASRGKLRGQKLPVMESDEQVQREPAKSPPKASGSSAASSSRLPSNTPVPPPPASGPTMSSFSAATPNVKLEDSPPTMMNSFDMASNMAWTMDMPDPQTWSTPAPAPKISGLPLPTRPMIPNNTTQSMTPETPLLYAPIVSPTASFSSPVWPTTVPYPAQSATPPSSQDMDEEEVKQDPNYNMLWNAAHSPSLSQLLLARSVGRTPRIRYLISYYAEVIAPMIVAFDTPTNPFRTHVIRLAMESEALQEAIATLATSNLRQRREHNHLSTERTLPARMSSMAHRALTDEDFQDRYGISMTEGYIREENHHRGMAVKALNADLADPRRRLSDSVLATLLMLCLFHGCDTGVAGFRAQFAGVTRLLAIRMRHSRVMTDDLKWFIRMFSWFDTLTATTNDRDVQLRGTCLDISSKTDGEWGLENLAGCDGRLFKLISQLGRLNLLSQDQEPNLSRPQDANVATTSLPPNMIFPGWENVVPDLGMGSVPLPGQGFSLPTPPPSSDSSRRPSSPAFWTEWYSLRQRLESWRFDPPTAPSAPSDAFPSPPLSASTMTWNATTYMTPMNSTSAYQVAPENLQDVFQISECFRHAALLYCERLAEPTLPSRHGRIQHLVQLAMHCIITVQSDVYLLWPLFIVGSECVQEDHRSIIRNRCIDISKDSGFINNLSCLELLEKIWAEQSDESSFPIYPSEFAAPPPLAGGRAPTTSQAFRWSRVMQAKRGDGEYMVA
ncbi:unnamed protein product [Penicillium salamii]|uniref:Zn(2)-C6 fungal-type domain-containing protein n=1 Tax=Penicillium salamii TaxID=1612424 RepID=A0A9W4J9P2_9EURO|nr:unnamed protein product [Penicillium salamii]CAG8105090.1 unnamed protein product [Penicillium salamii]CAG8376860.1 unnamed protein product [Penicillium salamii]CAG8378499.1 unnamed protein product [Penicillium salamii]CAG8380145.1 unnamed protein product [Penicillium salamii]